MNAASVFLASVAAVLAASPPADTYPDANEDQAWEEIETQAGTALVKPKPGKTVAAALSDALNTIDPGRRHDRDAKAAIAQLQGTWLCVWLQRNGKPDHREIGSRWVFDGAEVTVKINGRIDSKWNYKVHPTTDPKGIDWVNTQRPSPVDRGIFWLSGDTLVFCDGHPVSERPADFSDGPNLYVLRRVAPAQMIEATGTRPFPHGPAKDELAAFLVCPRDHFKAEEPIPLSYGLILVGPGLRSRDEEPSALQKRVWQPRPPMDPINHSWFEVAGPDGEEVRYQGVCPSYAAQQPSDENTVLLRRGSFFGRTHADLGRNLDLVKPGAFRDFDLRKPGTYKVRWFYETDPAEGVWHGKLISNEVTFEIR